MRRIAWFSAAIAAALALVAVVASRRSPERRAEPRAAESSIESARPAASAPSPNPSAVPSSAPAPAPEALQGFLSGRITTVDGETFEGRLRWGEREEAFWGDYFNGRKTENSWAARVAPEKLPKERHSIGVFGLKIVDHERTKDLVRHFMARFGDISRIDAEPRQVRVTLKSGSVAVLHRFEASDFDDGVQVWDASRGVTELDSRRIRTIELLPAAALSETPARLHGTVRTRGGEFRGFLQWDRQECVGSDELDGQTPDGELSVRFETIRSIARRSDDSSQVMLADGREIVLSDTNDVGEGNRGTYVDDPRYGRVLVSWQAFERVDFDDIGTTGPGYDDFPPGRPLEGVVVTKDGRSLSGRIVFDLDESETTETLDAPLEGVDYTIPFTLVSSIVPRRPERGETAANVTLRTGEALQLEPEGDLGETNAGILVLVNGDERSEYVPWSDVERIDFGSTAAGGGD